MSSFTAPHLSKPYLVSLGSESLCAGGTDRLSLSCRNPSGSAPSSVVPRRRCLVKWWTGGAEREGTQKHSSARSCPRESGTDRKRSHATEGRQNRTSGSHNTAKGHGNGPETADPGGSDGPWRLCNTISGAPLACGPRLLECQVRRGPPFKSHVPLELQRAPACSSGCRPKRVRSPRTAASHWPPPRTWPVPGRHLCVKIHILKRLRLATSGVVGGRRVSSLESGVSFMHREGFFLCFRLSPCAVSVTVFLFYPSFSVLLVRLRVVFPSLVSRSLSGSSYPLRRRVQDRLSFPVSFSSLSPPL